MRFISFSANWIQVIRLSFVQVSRRAQDVPWLLIIGAIGVTLRWTGLVSGALWFDEAYSVTMARFDLLDMMQILRSNISPPLWELVVWFTTRIIGRNDLAYRIVPFALSVLALFVFWRLTQELRLARMQQWFAFALLALSPYQLWVAQEARMYSMMSVLYLLGILWTLQGRYLGLTAVMGLLLWSHNTGLFFAASLGMLALVLHLHNWRAIVFSGACVLLLWLPWVPVLFGQSKQDIPWLLPLTFQGLTFSFVFDLFASTALWTGGPILPTLLFYFSVLFAVTMQALGLVQWLTSRKRIASMDRSANPPWVATFAFGMPLSLFFLSSLFFQNTLLYRTTSPLIPPLMLWLAVALIPSIVRPIHWVLPSIWIGLTLWGLLIWSPQDRGSNLLQVVNVIKNEWQPGDMIYHANDMTAVLFSYYLPDKNHYIIDEKELAGGYGIVESARLNVPREALEKIPHTRAWIVSPYYDYASPPDERLADRRMRVYSAPCFLTGIIPYWQHAYVAVHLCLDSAPQQNASK